MIPLISFDYRSNLLIVVNNHLISISSYDLKTWTQVSYSNTDTAIVQNPHTRT